jgi:UDP-glucose 4-epimerase
MQKSSILLTGGLGYIGSHIAVCLQQVGYKVVVVDDCSNSTPQFIPNIEAITGQKLDFEMVEVSNVQSMSYVMRTRNVRAVIHLAGFKSVGESLAQTAKYLRNNIGGLTCLLQAMSDCGVKNLVFSSSATVYGVPTYSQPLVETDSTGWTNPYGMSKLMGEHLIEEFTQYTGGSSVALRYFNPAGAHASGLIGEAPVGAPNNLIPYVSGVAMGKYPEVQVFGGDYPTTDGTGVRDYIHVLDLAEGHRKALEWLDFNTGHHVFNLGTGTGYSVLQLIAEFSKASGVNVPYKVVARRDGDVPYCVASPYKAELAFGWTATKDLTSMCEDQWRWEKHLSHVTSSKTVI